MADFLRLSPFLAGALLAFAGVASLSAQTSPAPIFSDGFENSISSPNLWSGVDEFGYLAGEEATVMALNPQGAITALSMPISVGVADMNGDGLPDIVAMSPQGYLRIYFNSGTKTQPKFTTGEIIPLFLTRSSPKDLPSDALLVPAYLRYAPHICLYDARKSGKYDLYVGNYFGEVFYVPNEGTGLQPAYRQPADISRLLIATSSDASTKWGNLFAPCVWDANRDGKDDLLLGEGSYSANNIHLLLNSGFSGHPTFDDKNRSVLAFGDGRQQLTPTMVDYNGDGYPDLLVVDRTGKIALYLNPGATWKPGMEFPFTSFVEVGGGVVSDLTGGGVSTITTGDLNGDGLFDLIVGKANGHISICYNTGTRTAPKFSTPEELKGEPSSVPMKLPPNWDVDYGQRRGNYYGYASIVTAVDDPNAKAAEGTSCLKFGYLPCPNKILPAPLASQYTGAMEQNFMTKNVDLRQKFSPDFATLRLAPANYFLLQKRDLNLQASHRYTLSFKVKGSGMTNGQLRIGWRGRLNFSDDRIIESGDRGAAKIIKNRASEVGKEQVNFNAGSDWTEVRKDFDTTFKDKSLNVSETSLYAAIEITFALQPMDGKLYIDDVRLTPK